MSKLAILQMSDTPQIESSALQLRYGGYEVKVCSSNLRDHLKRMGCDTVTPVAQMVNIGYDELDTNIGEASVQEWENCDLYCEIKYRNLQKVWQRYPDMKRRSVWWRVNGARPENCEAGGEEINVECPVIGANLWYGTPEYNPYGRNYTFWPPYARSGDFDIEKRVTDPAQYTNPFCLCHGIQGWGFKEIIPECQAMGVTIHGIATPDDIIPHRYIPKKVSTAIAMVHLKSVDCPGWAIYEAMLGGCPLICGRLLINRMLGWDLFVENETCLAFGLPGDETGRGDMAFDQCIMEIRSHLDRLRDPAENQRIGRNAREKLLDLMWREDRDGEALKKFLRQFP